MAEYPFAHLRSGSTASVEDHYVTPAEAAAIIDALPDAEWKLLFGLARHAGLRVPSESHLLTWADVDLGVLPAQTCAPQDRAACWPRAAAVPITPTLMKLLQARFDTAGDGRAAVRDDARAGHVRRTVEAAMKRAGGETVAEVVPSLPVVV